MGSLRDGRCTPVAGRDPENFKFSDPIYLKEIGSRLKAVVLALLIGGGLAGAGSAQGASGENRLSRALELPSHRALMARVARPGSTLRLPSVMNSVTETTPFWPGSSFRDTIVCSD